MILRRNARHLPIFSPSQIDTAKTCRRKWAFTRLWGRGPANASALLGSAVHAQLERYFKHFVAPDMNTHEGQIAAQALPYLPPAGLPGLAVEGGFALDFAFAWSGYIDLRLGPIVYDHKTTKDYRYAKTEDELATDAQALIYALYAFEVTGERVVTLRWTYLDTTMKKRPHVVSKKLDKATAISNIGRTLTIASELASYANVTHPLQVPPDFTGCRAYGGCPYEQWCPKPGAGAMIAAFMRQRAFDETR